MSELAEVVPGNPTVPSPSMSVRPSEVFVSPQSAITQSVPDKCDCQVCV